jgi:hypothetical protein
MAQPNLAFSLIPKEETTQKTVHPSVQKAFMSRLKSVHGVNTFWPNLPKPPTLPTVKSGHE